jgi:hypothetical protein
MTFCRNGKSDSAKCLISWWAHKTRTLDPLIKSQLLYQLSSLVIAARADQAATAHEGSGKDRLADDRLSADVGGCRHFFF